MEGAMWQEPNEGGPLGGESGLWSDSQQKYMDF